MSLLSKKQSIGYILRSFSETDFLTVKDFLEAIYITLYVHADIDELTIDDTLELMDRITLEMSLSMNEHIQVKTYLERNLVNYTYYQAEKFYDEFVTDEILRKFYK